MLDLKYVLEHLDEVRTNCRDRNVSADVVKALDFLLADDQQRRSLLQRVEDIRRRQNLVSQATAKESDPDRRKQLVEEGKGLKVEIKLEKRKGK